MEIINSKQSNIETGSIFKKGVQFLYKLAAPISENEDVHRREFILNIILLGSLVLCGVAITLMTIQFISLGSAYQGVPPIILFIVFGVFFGLYTLSKARFSALSSYLLISIYLISATYTIANWGVDVPQGVLIYALIIVASGILISTRFAFYITLLISGILILLTYLQVNAIRSPALNWKSETTAMSDTVAIVFTFAVISILSWLSNREIERSLRRARSSEEALKKERDSLEVKVEERTEELKKAQLEKISQLYHFAEFGRLASGLFHDLVNPLTVVSFNLEELNARTKEKRNKALMDMASTLNQAMEGTRRMQVFIESVRKQIQQQESKVTFSIEQETNQAVRLLSFKAREQNAMITFSPTTPIRTYGDPVKFFKVVSNLLSNAIDAYEDAQPSDERYKILITLSKENNMACLKVQDWGKGIVPEQMNKIFEPFFTTKNIDKGTGLGLSICKNITENDFNGRIYAQSKPGEGTTFVVEFPIRENADKHH